MNRIKTAGVGNVAHQSHQRPPEEKKKSFLSKHKGKIMGGLAAGAAVGGGLYAKKKFGGGSTSSGGSSSGKTPKIKGLDKLKNNKVKGVGERSSLGAHQKAVNKAKAGDYSGAAKAGKNVVKDSKKGLDDHLGAGNYKDSMKALKGMSADELKTAELLGLYKAAGLMDKVKGLADKAKNKIKKGKRHMELRGGAHPSKKEWMNMPKKLKEINKHNRIKKASGGNTSKLLEELKKSKMTSPSEHMEKLLGKKKGAGAGYRAKKLYDKIKKKGINPKKEA